ncbi:Hydrogenobyrinate a,c-diamide synthase [Georgfuchsia toluolica]|uniref:Hydrogenobyrinate a,c-diamide synthase n=1 Tax=Georgfuchsia toluolica TaxID=424218 RepID=A0A916J541_9PROT|nr:cobyrinate a,c-diamide synthase [Georgfuchsia toluolica]CAG4884075.1 Hydrogenobyrinate a,c-diamide synthase [Georgfuchsia toluolica]
MATCSALLIAAPASGQGKTTVTAALARLYTHLGRRVRVFKCGPDFLDPQILAVASGAPVYNLDFGMCGEEDAAQRLADAARNADLILVEGVMGLYDGMPSAADIACRFNIPVLGLIDAAAMAQTFGAVAYGLAHYRTGLPFSGVLANKVGSAFHAELLRTSLPPDMVWYGALPRDAEAALPERHLGLLQADEISDLDARLDRLANVLQSSLVAGAALPPAVEFPMPAAAAQPALLRGKVIAVARDAAFGFIYPANLDTLIALGAELRFFSPLAGAALPACDAIWLPGGYPELHAATLAARGDLWAALHQHFDAGKAVLAECGGMMALFETLVDRAGARHSLAGLLPGTTAMQPRLSALGTQFAALPEGRLSGHTFHFSKSETTLAPLVRAVTPEGRAGEAVYRVKRLTASYVHFYFPSNPRAVAALLTS